jgi:hypothetical protein
MPIFSVAWNPIGNQVLSFLHFSLLFFSYCLISFISFSDIHTYLGCIM